MPKQHVHTWVHYLSVPRWPVHAEAKFSGDLWERLNGQGHGRSKDASRGESQKTREKRASVKKHEVN